jgi:2-methylcitrate dehydratase PrpD
MTLETTATTRDLAAFASSIRYEDLPREVSERVKELFLDWVAATLAGKNARPVRALERFAETMGPADGPCEILTSRDRTSSLFAALVNGTAPNVRDPLELRKGELPRKIKTGT